MSEFDFGDKRKVKFRVNQFGKVRNEFVTDKCLFDDLLEKRRTLYSLTHDDMQKYRWLKPLLVAQLSSQNGHWTGTYAIRVSPGLEMIKSLGRTVENNCSPNKI
jgi:hypothetical protein